MLRNWSPNPLIMNPLNCLTYFSAVFTVLTVSCFGSAASEDCGQEELAACSRPLQVLTETSELSFVTNKSELDKLCPDLLTGLSCIRSYTRRCMNMEQRTHFHKLYQGTADVINEMCQTGPYQEEFLRHSPCMQHVKAENDVCSRRYQHTMQKVTAPTEFELQQQLHMRRQLQREQRERHQNHHNYHHNSQNGNSQDNNNSAGSSGSSHEQQHESRHQHHQQHQQQHQMFLLNGTELDPLGAASSNENALTSAELEDERKAKQNLKLVCCAFKEYGMCTERTVRTRCGEEAAYFARSFIDKVSSSMMRIHCENITTSGACGEQYSGSSRTTAAPTLLGLMLTGLLPLLAAFVVGFH